jgi:O-antigen/teichoic acid export membrane protein
MVTGPPSPPRRPPTARASRNRTSGPLPLSQSALFLVLSKPLQSVRQALSGSFLRAVTVLSSGALIAQIISFVGGAVVARYMYPPATQDLQSTFAALLATLAPLMTLRYDAAVVLPSHDQDARHLCWLNLIIGMTSTAVVGAGVVLVAALHPAVSVAIWALPLAVLAQSLTQPALTWCTRKGLFVIQSVARVVQALVLPLAATATFLAFGARPENLPWAMTLSLLLSGGLLLGLLHRTGNLPWRAVDRPSHATLSALAREFRRLPLINTPMNLADLGSQAVLVWCLASISDGVSACYAQTLVLLRAPMLLLGTSVSQVYASRAAQLVDHPVELKRLTLNTILVMSVPAAALASFFGLAGPWFFTTIYGPQWRLSGEFSQLLVWGFACNMMISPVSMLPTILNKNLGHLLQMIGLGAARVVASLLAMQHSDAHELVRNVAIIEVAFNLLFTGFVVALAHRHTRKSAAASRSSAA